MLLNICFGFMMLIVSLIEFAHLLNGGCGKSTLSTQRISTWPLYVLSGFVGAPTSEIQQSTLSLEHSKRSAVVPKSRYSPSAFCMASTFLQSHYSTGRTRKDL